VWPDNDRRINQKRRPGSRAGGWSVVVGGGAPSPKKGWPASTVRTPRWLDINDNPGIGGRTVATPYKGMGIDTALFLQVRDTIARPAQHLRREAASPSATSYKAV